MSLSNLLDIPQVQDFLRGLMNTMNEYDQAREEPDRQPKIVSFYLITMGRSPLTVGPAVVPVQSSETASRWRFR